MTLTIGNSRQADCFNDTISPQGRIDIFRASPGVARRHCTPAIQEWIATQVRIGLWVGVSLILLLVAGGESSWFPWVNFGAIALFGVIVMVAERRFRRG